MRTPGLTIDGINGTRGLLRTGTLISMPLLESPGDARRVLAAILARLMEPRRACTTHVGPGRTPQRSSVPAARNAGRYAQRQFRMSYRRRHAAERHTSSDERATRDRSVVCSVPADYFARDAQG